MVQSEICQASQNHWFIKKWRIWGAVTSYKADDELKLYVYLVDLLNALSYTSNHTPSKVWDEIIYPFLNFNGCTVEV